MNLTIKLGMKQGNLIQKFKAREQQKQIEQALVYLKLKQFKCPTNTALIFAKKKQKAIDGTLEKDGPANFRKLKPIKPEGQLKSGWLRGQKLKYEKTISYNDYQKQSTSETLAGITSYNRKFRDLQENERRQRCKSLLNLNVKNFKETIEKIVSIKDNVMKQRQNNNLLLKIKGVELVQMTKFYTQDILRLDTNGLVVKTGAFQHCINDHDIDYSFGDENGLQKSVKSAVNSVQGVALQKRKDILAYKSLIQKQNLVASEQKKEENTQQRKKKLNMSKSFYHSGQSSKTVALKLKRSQSQLKKTIQIQGFHNGVDKILRKDHWERTSSYRMGKFRLGREKFGMLNEKLTLNKEKDDQKS